MVKLVLEASDGYLSLALFNDNNLLLENNIECKRNLSEVILLELDILMNKCNISKQQLTEIIVTRGPGSYTALRVVMSIAKTISFALNIPIKTISTLLLMSKNNYSNSIISVPLIDGRRGNVYSAVYRNKEVLLAENYYSFDTVVEFVNSLEEEVVFIGNDLVNFDFSRVKVQYKLINDYAHAKNYLLIEEIAEQTDYFNAVPSYLRLTEAERNLNNDKN